MSTLSRRTVTALAVSFGLFAMLGIAVPGPAAANDTEQALRAGGLVIVVRHGATFADQADTDPLNFENVAKQRQLNAKGEEAAKAFGGEVDVAREGAVYEI